MITWYPTSNQCSKGFSDGLTISLTAVSDPWWTESSQTWGGDCIGGGTTCLVLMNSNKEISTLFRCELITIPMLSSVDATELWQCDRLEALQGFEITGQGDVTFKAETSIELGAGFRVGDKAIFRAIVTP